MEHTEKDLIKSLLKRREVAANDMERSRKRLSDDLAVAWPELLTVDIFKPAILNFLTVYGCPADVRAAGPGEIEEVLGGKGMGATADYLKSLAKDSIGLDDFGMLVKISAKMLIVRMESFEETTAVLVTRAKKELPDEFRVLTSVPGIGEDLAGVFLAEIDPIATYPSAQHLMSYMSINPGKHKDINLPRRNLCIQMANAVVSADPNFRMYFLRKVASGYRQETALKATASKLIKVIYTLLSRTASYEPAAVFAE